MNLLISVAAFVIALVACFWLGFLVHLLIERRHVSRALRPSTYIPGAEDDDP